MLGARGLRKRGEAILGVVSFARRTFNSALFLADGIYLWEIPEFDRTGLHIPQTHWITQARVSLPFCQLLIAII
jgi:hypothetical protein